MRRWSFLGLTVALVLACQNPRKGPPRPELVEAVAGVEPVAELVRARLAAAQRDGHRLVVYVSASWCQPCERFQASLRSGALDAYLPGVRFLKFDHDRDRDALAASGYAGEYLPRFVLPEADGRGSERRIEGGTKAEDTVFTSIGPRLQQLLGLRVGGPSAAR